MALLVGAVLSPTDPAILIPLFVRSRLKPKVAQTVIAESAFNDPTGAALALTFAGVVLTGSNSVTGPAGEFLVDLGISTVIGIVAGVVLAAAISSHRMGDLARERGDRGAHRGHDQLLLARHRRRQRLPGGVPGGADRREHGAPRPGGAERAARGGRARFAFNLADIVTLIVFMVLGANIPFGELGDNLLPALAVLATLMLVARPITVFVCAMPDRGARWTRNELAFLCWTRETGVVPAALVGVLAGLGVPDSDVFACVVALAIVLTLLLQALPARWLAGRLGCWSPARGRSRWTRSRVTARDEVVRIPVRVRDQSTRTLDQRLAIRFPRLSAALARRLFKLPPSSRLRQAMLRRVIQLGAEAYNRRDLEAVVVNYDPEIEYYPYREFVDAGLAEPCYHGPSGYRAYIDATYEVWGTDVRLRTDRAHRPRRQDRDDRRHADARAGQRHRTRPDLRRRLDHQGREGGPTGRLPDQGRGVRIGRARALV